jgi:hypothetical protein
MPQICPLSFLPPCVFLYEHTELNYFKLHPAKMYTDDTTLAERQMYAKYVYFYILN